MLNWLVRTKTGQRIEKLLRKSVNIKKAEYLQLIMRALVGAE